MTDETQKAKLTPERVAAGIAERCYTDSDFRQRFTDDPKACLEKESGRKLPGSIEIVTCENSDNKWYIPVPPSGAREISEEDMAKLSGGELFFTGTITAVAITVAVVGVGLFALGAAALDAHLSGDSLF